MQAIQFNAAIPRYALGLALRQLYPPILWSGLSCVQYREVAEPRLPNDEWVKIKTRYGGICGSDDRLLHLLNSPSASVNASFPFTIGHENCGTVAELGAKVGAFAIGERVVAEPGLWCKPRGFKDLCPACARGDIQICERVTGGAVSPGLIIGACRDTGGSWSPYFVAHQSQLVRVPDAVSDENALMVEPFATSLHAVLANLPREDDTVLVIGAGVIGLTIVAALRAIESRARIFVLARHPFQQDLARQLGADVVIPSSGDYADEYARAIGAKSLKPIFGKRVLVGGADVTFECVGNGDTIDDALRFTRSGGRVVLTGAASFPKGIDYTPVWMRELQIHGTYGYGHDEYRGERHRTFDVAFRLMTQGRVDLAPLVTHKFALRDYQRAFHVLTHRRRERAVKIVFDLSDK